MPPLATLLDLVDGLAAGERPAFVAFGSSGRDEWSYGRLAAAVREQAAALVTAGLRPGGRAALFAPDGPEWIIAALAIVRAAGVAVPLDAQLTDEALAHVLGDSAAEVVFTTADRETRVARLARAARLVRLGAPPAPPGRPGAPLPGRRRDDPATLFYTSGTTGPPKGVPLTHDNLVSQINALAALRLVAPGDRICVPLPLHHVYPFVVGILTPLALGLPVLLPRAVTGPEVIRALTEGGATVLIGVPRLYGALLSAIQLDLKRRGRVAAAAVGLALAGSRGARMVSWPWRAPLLAAVRARIGPRLRLLTSGGAALEPAIAKTLEAFGWDVATGYGLTETSPLLTFNPPRSGRSDSVGRAVPGVELRIAATRPGAAADGEIQARGPGVFAGYLNLPEKTRDAFTGDGWFRTRDLGRIDADGFVYVTGRADEMLVTPGGENVNPEAVEAAFLRHGRLRDFAVLQEGGRLVGLALPDVAAIERAGLGDVDRAAHAAVLEVNLALPSYQRVAAVAVTRDPLPRTRLGKLRRPLLPGLYASVHAGARGEAASGPIAVAEMVEADRQLLDDAGARRIWAWLSERYPGRRLTMDVSLGLDLGVDSLEWLGLTLEIERRAGVQLDAAAIGRVTTIRDLLRAVVDAPAASGPPAASWDSPARLRAAAGSQWLAPLGPVSRLVRLALIAVNSGLVRLLFRPRAVGLERLPDPPWVLVPNHVSFLDPLVLSAVLGRRRLERTAWGGWTGMMFTNPLMRAASRLWRALPVDQHRDVGSSLAIAAVALTRGDCLVWFPEGGRSRTGGLRPFRPGLGLLLARIPRPAVPVAIHGTFRAWPPGRWWIRPGRVTVVFGDPIDPLGVVPPGMPAEEAAPRIVETLHGAVADLAQGARPSAA